MTSKLSQIALHSNKPDTSGTQKPADIISFIQSNWGLGLSLYPVQRVILKAHYGIPLDDNPHGFDLNHPIPENHPNYDPQLVNLSGYYINRVRICDWRMTDIRYVSEAEYLRYLFDNGRCNIHTVIPGQERREMVLSVGRRSGKCVTGDTLVLTDKGVFPIKELGDPDGPEIQPLDVGVAQEGCNTQARSAYFYNGGLRDTKRVTTHCGYSIEGTPNHRVKVLGSDGCVRWAYLDDIKPGNHVAIHRSTNLWNTGPTNIGHRDGYTMGLIVGGKNVDSSWEDSSFDPEGGIPSIVLQSSKEVVVSFLQGLFEATGCYESNQWRLKGGRLTHHVQTVLLNLGLVTCRVAGDEPDQYILTVEDSDESSDYFYDPVVSVEDGRAHVYDLNVPEGHEFVANGMTNHNTLITSCIVAYETYKLLLKHNPQKFYGSSQSNVIQLISVATGRDQAGLLFREAKGHFSNCQFFKKYMANETMGYASFQTPFDIEQYGSYSENQKARYSIKVTFESCIAKSLRGGANILVALDEMAHFTDEGQSSADDVYQAVEPSIRTFSPKDPKDPSLPIGENEGRIIMISSPLGKQGLFYKQFMIGFTGGMAAQNMLSIEAPTWEVNPTIPAGTFENSYLKDPRVFLTEFGAQFTDKTASWIADNNDLLDCVLPEAKPRYKGLPRVPHFVGIDVGLVNDYTAIAIGHLDEQNRIVLDLIDSIKAGEGEYEGVERLEFVDVVDWIYSKSKDFYFKEGLFDQYSGIPLEQALQAQGLQQFNSYKPSPQINSQMFQTFKDFMFDKKLVLYDWPKEDGQHCQYITELLELQAEVKSKYVTSVYAPQMQGKHDDHADALVRMVWLASQQISSGPKYTTGVHKSGDVVIPGASRGVMAAHRKARMSGSSPERMTPQSLARKSSNLLFRNPKLPTKRRK